MNAADIRTILLNEWDPLGIGDNSGLSDEYDAYIPEIIRLIQSGSDAIIIDRYLREIEIMFGITPPSEGSARAAMQLTQRER